MGSAPSSPQGHSLAHRIVNRQAPRAVSGFEFSKAVKPRALAVKINHTPSLANADRMPTGILPRHQSSDSNSNEEELGCYSHIGPKTCSVSTDCSRIAMEQPVTSGRQGPLSGPGVCSVRWPFWPSGARADVRGRRLVATHRRLV